MELAQWKYFSCSCFTITNILGFTVDLEEFLGGEPRQQPLLAL